MGTNESLAVEQKKLLIKSPEFEEALKSGAKKRIRIQTTLKERNRNNFDVFYELMLSSRNDILEIVDTPKKKRSADDEAKLKAFKKQTSQQYKQVKELIYISEDDSMDENGVHRTVSKKLEKLVDQIANTVALLEYIGHTELAGMLSKRGIDLQYQELENRHAMFENEKVREDLCSVFNESVNIAKEVDGETSAIKVDIYENQVPSELRFDKDVCPTGIRAQDFVKLVALQTKVMEAEKANGEAKEKADKAVVKEAEQKSFDMARAEIIREKVMDIGFSDEDVGDEMEST